MKIQVTAEHIEKGVPYDGHCCPVALAMEAAGLPNPHVNRAILCWGPVDSTDPLTIVNTPPHVEQFTHDFDKLWSVRPFEFELELP